MKIALEITADEAQMLLHALRIGTEDGSLTNDEPAQRTRSQRLQEKLRAALNRKPEK